MQDLGMSKITDAQNTYLSSPGTSAVQDKTCLSYLPNMQLQIESLSC